MMTTFLLLAGYLLYGPPGCGKTSFAQVLAGELQLDICILNLTHAGLTDDAVAEYLRDAPQNAIIVLEDVDAIFVERTVTAKEGGDGKRGGNTTVSFSGLLNALDGVASQEGRLLFMTTNHIEKLDPALIRPGRCDVQLQLKLASKNQMERMFLRFYPGEETLAKVFAASLPANELSMAALQGYFLKCSESAQACVDQTRLVLCCWANFESVALSYRKGLLNILSVRPLCGTASSSTPAGPLRP